MYIVLLIIVLIILFISYKTYNNESFFSTNKLIFSNQNKTQFIQNKLETLLHSLSKFNYDLTIKGKKKLYIPQTTPTDLRSHMVYLSNFVVLILNSHGGKTYDFHISTIGNIKVIEKDNIKQYKYELFVYDMKNKFDLKLNVNLLTYNNKIITPKFISENADKFQCRTFDYYPIGTPSLYQYIPDAMSVITTANEVISPNGIQYPTEGKIHKLVLMSIKIDNSTLVIHPNKSTDNLKNVFSVSKTVLENGPKTGPFTPFYESGEEYNKWITLPDEPKNQKAWPCKKIPFEWDLLGCNPEVHPTKECPGKRSSTTQQPLTAQFWRCNYGIPQNGGKFNWLFNRVNASGAISSSASQPPP